MDPNQKETPAGLPGMLRAIGVLAILSLALIGILAVLELIPREALQEWFTRGGLILAIVVAAVIATALLMRGGRKA